MPKPKKRAQPKQRRALNKKPAFLAAFAICGSITEAAAAAGIDRSMHYDWLENDPAYPERFAEAKRRSEDALEDEATSRATRGVWEPNVYQGRFVFPQEAYEIQPAKGRRKAIMGTRDVPGAPPIGVWKKSDGLLMFRLRGAFAKYRQGALELTGANGGPVEMSIVERLNAARDRLAKATAPAA